MEQNNFMKYKMQLNKIEETILKKFEKAKENFIEEMLQEANEYLHASKIQIIFPKNITDIVRKIVQDEENKKETEFLKIIEKQTKIIENVILTQNITKNIKDQLEHNGKEMNKFLEEDLGSSDYALEQEHQQQQRITILNKIMEYLKTSYATNPEDINLLTEFNLHKEEIHFILQNVILDNQLKWKKESEEEEQKVYAEKEVIIQCAKAMKKFTEELLESIILE